ncbi:hypothetical protein [Membranihabitans maritimus]|uniref:hypothetical protein n=1 Tax=Membranihabitans maritimus TaxID=2904244 RepID=UPI001F163C5B|nr:hypothetical protein [Membranihabitans maritimus]
MSRNDLVVYNLIVIWFDSINSRAYISPGLPERRIKRSYDVEVVTVNPIGETPLKYSFIGSIYNNSETGIAK